MSARWQHVGHTPDGALLTDGLYDAKAGRWILRCVTIGGFIRLSEADARWIRHLFSPEVWEDLPPPGLAEAEQPETDTPARPPIVCLCGSTRFWRVFQEVGLQETLAGRIVLSIGAARAADKDDRSFGGYVPADEYDAVKQRLDELHKRKIDLADSILVLSDETGYFGPSTLSEIRYAVAHGKPIRWLDPAAQVRYEALAQEEAQP